MGHSYSTETRGPAFSSFHTEESDSSSIHLRCYLLRTQKAPFKQSFENLLTILTQTFLSILQLAFLSLMLKLFD